jgi:hypothetical protein
LAGILTSAFLISSCHHSAHSQHESPTPTRLSEDGREWLNAPPDGVFLPGYPEVARKNIFEVRASWLVSGLVMLGDNRAMQVEENEALGYVGPCFHSEPNKRPYLVRAVHCAQGGFHVYIVETSIAVISEELSHSACPSYWKTLLIVNLSTPPKAVYVDVQQNE